MAPALEYMCETAPREPYGLSAFDVAQGFALLTDAEKRLAPLEIAWSAAETDVAVSLFDRFQALCGMHSRATAEEALRQQEELNQRRSVRFFDAGEVVVRQLPGHARPAKHLMGDRCTGPHIVLGQRIHSSAILQDPATGKLVDSGGNVSMAPFEDRLRGLRYRRRP